eukprot:scaffold12456_cov36-Tisochrysis_lutea.AAC.4
MPGKSGGTGAVGEAIEHEGRSRRKFGLEPRLHRLGPPPGRGRGEIFPKHRGGARGCHFRGGEGACAEEGVEECVAAGRRSPALHRADAAEEAGKLGQLEGTNGEQQRRQHRSARVGRGGRRPS